MLVGRVQKQNYITGLILLGYALEFAKADAAADIKVLYGQEVLSIVKKRVAIWKWTRHGF